MKKLQRFPTKWKSAFPIRLKLKIKTKKNKIEQKINGSNILQKKGLRNISEHKQGHKKIIEFGQPSI